jgi:hypothetical protein
MDNSPYLELSRKLFKKTGNFIMVVTQVPESNDFVLEFPFHHPQNSDKLDFLGIELKRFNPLFNQFCNDIFSTYISSKTSPINVDKWVTIEGRNEWTIYEGGKNSIYIDFKLWIDSKDIGKLFLYTRANNQNKFIEVFEIGTDIYQPLGAALSFLTPRNSAVRCSLYLRAFADKNSGALKAVDLAMPYASDAAKIGAMFANNNL